MNTTGRAENLPSSSEMPFVDSVSPHREDAFRVPSPHTGPGISAGGLHNGLRAQHVHHHHALPPTHLSSAAVIKKTQVFQLRKYKLLCLDCIQRSHFILFFLKYSSLNAHLQILLDLYLVVWETKDPFVSNICWLHLHFVPPQLKKIKTTKTGLNLGIEQRS